MAEHWLNIKLNMSGPKLNMPGAKLNIRLNMAGAKLNMPGGKLNIRLNIRLKIPPAQIGIICGFFPRG